MKLAISSTVCRPRVRKPRLGTTRRSAVRLSRRPTPSPRRAHLHKLRPVRSVGQDRPARALPRKGSPLPGPVASPLPGLVTSRQPGLVASPLLDHRRVPDSPDQALAQVAQALAQVAQVQAQAEIRATTQVALEAGQPSLDQVADPETGLAPRDREPLDNLQTIHSRTAPGNPGQVSPVLDSQGRTLLVLASRRLTPRKV